MFDTGFYDLVTCYRCPKVMSVVVRSFSTPVKRVNKSMPGICSIWGETIALSEESRMIISVVPG